METSQQEEGTGRFPWRGTSVDRADRPLIDVAEVPSNVDVLTRQWTSMRQVAGVVQTASDIAVQLERIGTALGVPGVEEDRVREQEELRKKLEVRSEELVDELVTAMFQPGFDRSADQTKLLWRQVVGVSMAVAKMKPVVAAVAEKAKTNRRRAEDRQAWRTADGW